jgi:hypothetical protein
MVRLLIIFQLFLDANIQLFIDIEKKFLMMLKTWRVKYFWWSEEKGVFLQIEKNKIES